MAETTPKGTGATVGHAQGTVSWIDLSTSDVDAALDFYCGLFGWEPGDALPPEAGGYRMPLLNGGMVGGVGPRQDPSAPPAWTVHFATEDVDAVAANVAKNGGTVLMPPMDVMDAVRMGVFADPAGAVFGVVEERTNQGMQVERVPGAFGWAELATTDIAAARRFYTSIIPGVTEKRWDGEMEYYILSASGREVAGMFSMGDQKMPPMWTVDFTVANAEKTIDAAKRAGAEVVMGPMTSEGVGTWAVLRDPQGASFAVLQREG